jgi:hypothetical protein
LNYYTHHLPESVSGTLSKAQSPTEKHHQSSSTPDPPDNDPRIPFHSLKRAPKCTKRSKNNSEVYYSNQIGNRSRSVREHRSSSSHNIYTKQIETRSTAGKTTDRIKPLFQRKPAKPAQISFRNTSSAAQKIQKKKSASTKQISFLDQAYCVRRSTKGAAKLTRYETTHAGESVGGERGSGW